MCSNVIIIGASRQRIDFHMQWDRFITVHLETTVPKFAEYVLDFQPGSALSQSFQALQKHSVYFALGMMMKPLSSARADRTGKVPASNAT